MTLKIGRPSLDNGSVELTPQQQRANNVEQNHANLGNVESKLENASGFHSTFDKYPDGVREFLQGELAKNCYIHHGANPDIKSVSEGISPTTQEKYIHAQVGEFLYTAIHPDKSMEKYAEINPSFDLTGTRSNLVQQAHQIEVERTFNAERGALTEALKDAKNERLMAVVARSNEIDNASWWDKFRGKVPEAIPNITEQSLSKEEMLKHVDPKIAESETFQTMLDTLVARLDGAITREVGVEFWDTMWESTKDTAKTVDAFVEVSVAEGLNTGTKIGMNVGAITLGTLHGIKEGSLDEGITAMREIRDGAVEQYKVEARESSQEILANSPNLQVVGNTIHNGMEWSYGKIGEHLGDEAQFIARGAMEAAGDIAFVFGAGAGTTRMVKGVKGFTSELNQGYLGNRLTRDNRIVFDKLYKEASIAKTEIDVIAEKIANEFNGSVAKAPLKSRERAIEKIINDYDGNSNLIKDLARNTIIVEENNIPQVIRKLKELNANIKEIKPTSDSFGYSGINTTVKTKSGIVAEIQVNTAKMIYGKEPENIAKIVLGEHIYKELKNNIHVEGGKGHVFYEKIRSMPSGIERDKLILGRVLI